MKNIIKSIVIAIFSVGPLCGVVIAAMIVSAYIQYGFFSKIFVDVPLILVAVFLGLIEFGKVGMIYLDAIENSRNRKIKLYKIVYVFFIVVSFVVGAFHWIDANSDKKIEQMKTALQDDNKQVVNNLREQTELNKEQIKNEMRRDINMGCGQKIFALATNGVFKFKI